MSDSRNDPKNPQNQQRKRPSSTGSLLDQKNQAVEREVGQQAKAQSDQQKNRRKSTGIETLAGDTKSKKHQSNFGAFTSGLNLNSKKPGKSLFTIDEEPSEKEEQKQEQKSPPPTTPKKGY